VSLAVIIDPEPAGFHTELDTQTTMIVWSASDFENYNETPSAAETVVCLPSDGAFGTDPAADPLPSHRNLRRTGGLPLPSPVPTQIATTVLRP
jgi:hypothetical protein